MSLTGGDSDRLRRLVEEALLAVLQERGWLPDSAQGAAGGPPPGKRLLLALTGGEGGADGLDTLCVALRQLYSIDLLVTPCFRERFPGIDPARLAGGAAGGSRILTPGQGTVPLSGRVAAAAAVVMPVPARTTLAKVSLGITDDPASEVLFSALERGVAVVAGRTGLDQALATLPPAMSQGPSSLRGLVELYMQRLAGWGVRWSAVGEIPGAVADAIRGGSAAVSLADGGRGAAGPPAPPVSSVILAHSMLPMGIAGARQWAPAHPRRGLPGAAPRTPGRRFITREDIWTLRTHGGTNLRLAPGDIVTDEAQETAAKLGVRIEIVAG
jgi:hypothetical protein